MRKLTTQTIQEIIPELEQLIKNKRSLKYINELFQYNSEFHIQVLKNNIEYIVEVVFNYERSVL